MDRIRENKKTLIITSLVLLIPMIVGLLLWNRLPDRIAINWGADGEANDWAGRAMVVFGVSPICLAVQWLLVTLLTLDPRRKAVSEKVFRVVLWICPAVFLLVAALIYLNALNVAVSVPLVAKLILGVMLIVLGNLLPKNRRNFTVGFRVPWILLDDDKWDRVQRFGGRIMLVAGVLIVLCAVLDFGGGWSVGALLAAAVIVPTVYSVVISRKKA